MSNVGRVSIPGKIFDLLWNDEHFFSSIEKNKKVLIPRFPRFDQWCCDKNLYMEFALAGYSENDIDISVIENRIFIKSIKDSDKENSIQQGMIVRGIAKRKFEVSFVLSNKFSLKDCSASMKDGLLKLTIPKTKTLECFKIKILKEEN